MTRTAGPGDLLGELLALPGQGPSGYCWSLNATKGEVELRVGTSLVVSFGSLASTRFDSSAEHQLEEDVRRNWYPHLRKFPDFAPDLARSSAVSANDSWVYLTRLSAACVRVVEEKMGLGDPDAALDLPLFYRVGFLTHSAPFRVGLECLRSKAGRVFSPWGADTLAWRARRAREAWAEMILAFEDHPRLATGADPAWLEREAELLISSGNGPRRELLRLDPKVLSGGSPKPCWWWGKDQLVLSHRLFAIRVLREFFLPRFRLWRTGSTVLQLWGRSPWQVAVLWSIGLLLALVGIAPLPAILVAGAGGWALEASALAYLFALLLLVVAVIRWGSAVAFPFALRFAGGAALGSSLLLSVPGEWWSEPQRSLWMVWGLLVLAAFGYLVVEVRAHAAVGFWSTLSRAAGALFWGWCHGSGVAAVVLGVAGGVFMAFSPAGPAELASALAVAAAVGLSLGVFLQILWEDRPVTYPLTHMEWRRR